MGASYSIISMCPTTKKFLPGHSKILRFMLQGEVDEHVLQRKK